MKRCCCAPSRACGITGRCAPRSDGQSLTAPSFERDALLPVSPLGPDGGVERDAPPARAVRPGFEHVAPPDPPPRGLARLA